MQFRRIFCFAAVAALACLLNLNDAMAQRGGPPGMNSKLQLLGNSTVQEELGLVEDQKEGLRDIESMTRDIMREVFSGMREKFANLSREERDEMMEELRGQISEKMKDVTEKLDDVLLPHQMERLDQLAMQNLIRQRGVAGAASSDELKELLGLSSEEAEKLKEKEEEVKKELDEKIKELRKKAQDDILSVLSADKRKKFKDMIGDSFEISAESWRRNRGNRGGGNRGGGRDRGGRGGF